MAVSLAMNVYIYITEQREVIVNIVDLSSTHHKTLQHVYCIKVKND